MLLGMMAPAGSGKSKASKHLKKRYGFVCLHAGQPVKDAMREGFGLEKYAVDGKGKDVPHIVLGGATPRAVMEHLSQAIAEHAPHATAIALHRRLARALSAGHHVVVDGIRQKAEVDLLHKHGGKIILIDTGKSPDPDKPMDEMQAQLAGDHRIFVPSGKKKDVKKALDDWMSKTMAADCAV
jgi:dephospho-CoA kinase